jgi:prepilin-type N-terminal cleavage/methylation domain-containing protein
VAIRPPKYNSQGFTLIEMIVTVMVAGIIMAFATPSLLSLNKPLRDGSLQFKSQLSLIRSKAISSSKAYRIRPKFDSLTLANYPDGRARNFVVEYADNCKMPENSATPAAVRWQAASQFDLDLPQNIGIPDTTTTTLLAAPTTVPAATVIVPTGTVTNSLSGIRICFDNRGILDSTSTTRVALRDFQGFNRAKLSLIELTTVGNADVYTYTTTSSNFTGINVSSEGNPEF